MGLEDGQMIRHFLIFSAAGALALHAWPANAQDEATTRVRVGLGASYSPKFPGADKNEFGPLVDVSIARGTELFDFEAPDDSFDIDLFSGERFSAGPVLALQGSRKNSDVGAPVGKVPTTVEAGGFVQFEASEAVRLRAEVRRGLGGHDGLISSLGGDYVWRDGDKYQFSIGPRLLIADRRYQRAYFEVTPEAAIATGLPVYRPDGGLYAAAATSGFFYAFNSTWGAFGFARYERLLGDAKKSPIVKSFGSPNQYSAGLGLTYTFSIRR